MGIQTTGGGGGQNLTRRHPTENSFRPPSPRRILPPPPPRPLPSLLVDSLKKFPEFPSADLHRNSLRKVSKDGFQQGILARFCFSLRFALPPPPFSPAPILSGELLERPETLKSHSSPEGKESLWEGYLSPFPKNTSHHTASVAEPSPS